MNLYLQGQRNFNYDPYDARIGSGQLPQGIWGAQNRAYTRAVNPGELTSNNIYQMNQTNNPYIQQARRQAQASANARGMGNSSYAAGNAQAAAIRASLPIAQADAEANQAAATENLSWLNQRAMNDANTAAQIHSSNNASGAAMYQADLAARSALQRQRENLAYEGEQSGLSRAFQDYMNQQNQGYNVYNLNLANQFGRENWSRDMYGNFLQGSFQTMLSNPAYFNDPDAAMGFVSGWGSFGGNLINSYFGG